MAETIKPIIEIQVDTTAAVKAEKELTEAIVAQNGVIKQNSEEQKKLTQENKKVEAQAKKGSVTTQEASTTIQANNDKLKQSQIQQIGNKDKLQKLNTERKTAKKVVDLESNSLNALRQKTVELNKQRNKQNLGTVKGTAEFKRLTAEMDKNNKTIQKADQQAGQYSTSVGNYSGAMQGAIPGLGALNAGFLKLLKNPVVLIIAAITLAIQQLTQAFKRNADGQGLLAKGFGILKGVITVVQRAFDALAEVVIYAFTQPQEAWTDFVNVLNEGWLFIKKNVIDVFSGSWDVLVGSITLGAAKILLAWGKLTGDSEKVAEALGEIEKANKRIEEGQEKLNGVIDNVAEVWGDALDAVKEYGKSALDVINKNIELETRVLKLKMDNIKLTTDQAKANLEIAKNNKIIEDTTKSVENRQIALNKNEKIALNLSTQKIKNAEEELKILQETNALSGSTHEDMKAEAELESILIGLKQERFEAETSFQSKRISLYEETTDTLILTAEEELAAFKGTEEQKLYNFQTNLEKILKSEDLTAKKRAEIEKRLEETKKGIYNIDLANNKKADEKKLDIEQRNTDAKIYIAKLEQKEKRNILLDSVKDTNKYYETLEKFAKDDFNTETNLLKSRLEGKEITEQEFRALSLENKQAYNDRIKELGEEEINAEEEKQANLFGAIENGVTNSTDFFSNQLETRINNIDKAEQKELDILNKKFKKGLLSEEDYEKKKNEIEQKAELERYQIELQKFKVDKAAAIIDIGISTALGIMNTYEKGITAGIIGSATIGAMGLAQIGFVSSQVPPAPPTFAKGGQIQGKSHAQGGINLYADNNPNPIANVEGGEGFAVFQKGSATQDALSYINSSYGGRSFGSVPNSKIFQSGGNVQIEKQQTITTEMLTEAFANLPTPQVNVIDVENEAYNRNKRQMVGIV